MITYWQQYFFRDVMEKKVPSVKYYLSTVYVETLKRHTYSKQAA